MKVNFRKLITPVLTLGLALSLSMGTGYAPAYAQAENGVLNDLGEGENRILTSDWRTLNPGEQITYQVQYDGDDQPLSIWMNSIPAGAVNFQIWTDERLEQFGEDASTEPLGQGTAMNEGSGFTNWLGGSPEAETYYVVVTATGDTTARFLLNISSSALAADQPGAIALEGATPTQPTTPADPNIAVVTTDALNVRSGPSTAFPVLLTIPNGTEMTVLGRNAINSWINVQLADGTVGWVTRSLTSYTLVSPNVIAAPLGAAATVAATGTATATTNITGTDTITGTAPVTPTTTQTATTTLDTTELGENWQSLAPGETDWYTFQYRGGSLPLTVWMDMEPYGDATFTVVNAETAEAMMAGTAETPANTIGNGRANPVEPGYLFWQADFEEADTFYVMVQPAANAEGEVLYALYALGPGVARVVEPVDAADE